MSYNKKLALVIIGFISMTLSCHGNARGRRYFHTRHYYNRLYHRRKRHKKHGLRTIKDALRHALRSTRKRVHHLDSCETKKIKHKVVRFITCKEADGKKLWVVVDSMPYPKDNACHACRTELSFFVYKKSGKYWKLQAKNTKLLYFGSFGIPPSKGDIRLIKGGWKH